MRRAQRAQQAAYEVARTVLDRAHARRDAEWKEAASANRRRALTVLLSPFAVGALVGALGALALPLAAVGGALLLVWAILATSAWVSAGGRLKEAVGGTSVEEAIAGGVVGPRSGARFVDVTQGLCASLGVSVPELWVLPDQACNALTIGRDDRSARLVVSSGMLESLERVELEGALAHELSHVKRLDVLTSTLAATTVVRTLDAVFGGRLKAYLIGRCRELGADLAGVSLTRYPPGLLAALQKASPRGGGELPRLAGRDVTRFGDLFFAPPSQEDLSERLDVLQEL